MRTSARIPSATHFRERHDAGLRSCTPASLRAWTRLRTPCPARPSRRGTPRRLAGNRNTHSNQLAHFAIHREHKAADRLLLPVPFATTAPAPRKVADDRESVAGATVRVASRDATPWQGTISPSTARCDSAPYSSRGLQVWSLACLDRTIADRVFRASEAAGGETGKGGSVQGLGRST